MEEKAVLIAKKEAVCTLTMNRPTVKNAFSMDTLLELAEACHQIGSDKNTRVVVLEGAGGNFCTGADAAYFKYIQGAPEFLEMMEHFSNVVRGLRELPQPVICKVRGMAIGAGANLALSGDFVLASHNARFCQVFINVNIIPDGGGNFFLPRLVGMVKARELAFLGRRLMARLPTRSGSSTSRSPTKAWIKRLMLWLKNFRRNPCLPFP